MNSIDRRSVSLTRLSPGVFRVRNSRGTTLDIATGAGEVVRATTGDPGASDGPGASGDPGATGAGGLFTPVELLLAGIGGCSAMDVDVITGRRAEPDHFDVQVEAQKVRDEHGNHLQDIVLTFQVQFPDGAAGDAARDMLPTAVKRSHDRLCTVSRTVELGAHIDVVIDSPSNS